MNLIITFKIFTLAIFINVYMLNLSLDFLLIYRRYCSLRLLILEPYFMYLFVNIINRALRNYHN